MKDTDDINDIDDWIDAISDEDFGDVIVGMPVFFEEVGKILSDVSIDDWKHAVSKGFCLSSRIGSRDSFEMRLRCECLAFQ